MSNLDLKHIPKAPGIYKYFDKKWEIIYVGKSVNLFSRVHSYFNGKSKLNFAKAKMVDQIVKIETIIVENETESLILETNLIKQLKPKYNILMKDDKNYMYIKITNDLFPKIMRTRQSPSNFSVIRGKKNGTYFWPYISTNHVINILKIIKKYFWYGCYWHHFFKDWNGYNLDKYLFKNNISDTKKIISQHEINKIYVEQIENIKHFLRGNYKEVIEKLREKMQDFAKNLQFEEAQKIKIQIESLESLDISQNIRDKITGNHDVIHYLEKYEHIYIWVIEIRDGKILWYQTFEIENKLEEDKRQIVKEFIEKKYVEHLEEKEKINFILPFEIQDLLAEISFELPQVWPKKEILQMVYKNVYEHAHKKYINSLSTKWFTKSTMENLLKVLSYKHVNKSLIFECNDISHFSWTHTVASRSVIENGKPNTKKYKKFNIKTLEEAKIDDFWSMKEVMTRRLKEIEKTQEIPDLIIIDGWKWQLGSVVKILNNFIKNTLWEISILERNNSNTNSQDKKTEESILENKKNYLENLQNLQLVWIAKREEELFLPWESTSIILEKDSLELRLVQKIRDEAHRFAITFNRDKRIKAMKTNILESLPWFWPVARKKILRQFWSVENIKNFPKAEIEKYLNKNQVQTLDDHGFLAE